MSVGKRTLISILILTIIALSIWSIALDFSRFFSLNYDYDIYPSAILKRINVILVAAIAWAVGKDSLCLADSRIMKAAFLFVCSGETAFALNWRAVGIFFFAVCQTLLIIRNSAGFRNKLKYASQGQKKRFLILTLTLSFMLAAMAILFSSIIRDYSTTLIVFLYGTVLTASLWAGLTCDILGLLPKRNSKLVALGMICFYCCDVLVGLDAELQIGLPWLLANSFIWIFYTPSLTLLALSCYKYN